MYNQSAPNTIQSCFSSIASSYDRANAIASLGMHHAWNQKLVDAIGPANNLLDLCAGTGEIALRFVKKHPEAQATLLDFCAEMLTVAETKSKQFTTLVADAQKIPLPDQSFDAVTIAYGIRNVENSKACFEEVARVLQKGGVFGILELTRPRFIPLRVLHKSYTQLFLPIMGKLLSNNSEAYRYLAKSIQTFSSVNTLKKELLSAGLIPIETHSLFGGVATLIISKKP